MGRELSLGSTPTKKAQAFISSKQPQEYLCITFLVLNTTQKPQKTQNLTKTEQKQNPKNTDMLRFLARSSLKNPKWNPKPIIAIPQSPLHNHFSSKSGKSSAPKGNNNKADNQKPKKNPKRSGLDDSKTAVSDAKETTDERVLRARLLAQDEKNPSLNAGPNGRPLFTNISSLSRLSRKDTCSYFKFGYLFSC